MHSSHAIYFEKTIEFFRQMLYDIEIMEGGGSNGL